MYQVDSENYTRYATTSWWNLMFSDADFCTDEDTIYPERIRRNRELAHIMSDAFSYMSYTGLVEAAVCGRKDRVREIQNEFNKHVADLVCFSRERAINDRKQKQHMPWNNDDDIIHENFGWSCTS